jgi:hypothetical protein
MREKVRFQRYHFQRVVHAQREYAGFWLGWVTISGVRHIARKHEREDVWRTGLLTFDERTQEAVRHYREHELPSVYLHAAPRHARLGAAYHLLADTSDALEKAAAQIGLDPSWIQRPGTEYEHYDVMGQHIAPAKSLAVEIDDRTAVELIRRKRGDTSMSLDNSPQKMERL